MTKHEAIVTLTKLFGHDPEVNQALKIALMMLIDALDTETTPSMAGKVATKKVKTEPKKTEVRKRKKVDVGKIGALHKAGWSGAKIADEMGLSDKQVYYYLKKVEANDGK